MVVFIVAQSSFSGEIHDAVDRRDLARVTQLLDNNPAAVNERTIGGSTPLHLAVGLNNIKMTRLLIKRGADINAQTREGFTALHWAAFMNAGEAAIVLLQNGANANITTVGNETPLDIAKTEKSKAVVKVFSEPIPDEVIEAEEKEEVVALERVTQKAEAGGPAVAKAMADKQERETEAQQSRVADKPLTIVEELKLPEKKAPTVAKVAAGMISGKKGEEDIATLMNQARAAAGAEDYTSAYTLFTKLLRLDPGSEAVNFHYAMTCYKLQDFSRARLAFERVLNLNPKNPKAITMLGICNFMSGQYDIAKNYFNQALIFNPPESDKLQIEKYLVEIRKGIKRWSFSGNVNVGYFNDDNINVGPASDIVDISPIVYGSQTITELVLQDSSKPNETDGYLISLSLATGYDFGGKGGWSAFGSAAYFENWMEDEAYSQESLFMQANAGFQKTSRGSMVQIPFKGANINTGHKELMKLYGIAPVYVTAVGAKKNIQLQTAGSIEVREYKTLDSRDGNFWSVSETVKWFLGRARHNVYVGMMLSQDLTDQAVYEYLGISANVGASINMPCQSSVYSRVKYTNNEYAEKETLATEARSDEQIQWLIGIRKSFNRRCGIDLNYQATDNSSSFGLYEYERNVATLSTFFSF